MGIDSLAFGDEASARVLRAPRHAGDGIAFHGRFDVACVGPDGRERWRDYAENLVCAEGLRMCLEIMFRAQSAIANWYLGLVDNASFTTGFAGSDVIGAGGHPGWVENINYTNTNRPQWITSAASGGSITNPTSANFNMNATVTIKGLFLVSSNVVNGTSGTLFSEAAFSGGNQLVNTGDTLQCTYTLSTTSTT
jgi:hypothetical protein